MKWYGEEGCEWRVAVGFGEGIRIEGNHQAAILRQIERNAVALESLKSLFALK
jgi:hypothetical protein